MEEHMHSLLRVALRSLSDNSQGAFFPSKYWMPSRRLERVHMPFPARPPMWQGAQTREQPGTRDLLANPGREVKGAFHSRSAAKAATRWSALACAAPPPPLPSGSHTAIACYTWALFQSPATGPGARWDSLKLPQACQSPFLKAEVTFTSFLPLVPKLI